MTGGEDPENVVMVGSPVLCWDFSSMGSFTGSSIQ